MDNTNPADWTETPEALLEAVGINPDTRGDIFDYVTKCDGCGDYTGAYPDGYKCSRCNGTHHFVENRYTGPALGTPELDALLLVAGQRWCVENWRKYDEANDAIYDGNLQAISDTDTFVLEWLLFYCDTPGHALARAIKEVAG